MSRFIRLFSLWVVDGFHCLVLEVFVVVDYTYSHTKKTEQNMKIGIIVIFLMGVLAGITLSMDPKTFNALFSPGGSPSAGDEKLLDMKDPLYRIQQKDLRGGVLALLAVDDDRAWEILATLSQSKRKKVMEELGVIAWEHFEKSHIREAEAVVMWIEDHSDRPFSENTLLKAELLLFRNRKDDCAAVLFEITGEVDSIEDVDTSRWSSRLKDFFAASVLKGEIIQRPPVKTLGVREDIYIEDVVPRSSESETDVSAKSLQVLDVTKTSGDSSKRVRGLRVPFDGGFFTDETLKSSVQHIHKGMDVSDLVKCLGKPSRVVESKLPTKGWYATAPRTARWDYVTKDGNSGIVVVVLKDTVQSFSLYKRKKS